MHSTTVSPEAVVCFFIEPKNYGEDFILHKRRLGETESRTS